MDRYEISKIKDFERKVLLYIRTLERHVKNKRLVKRKLKEIYENYNEVSSNENYEEW